MTPIPRKILKEWLAPNPPHPAHTAYGRFMNRPYNGRGNTNVVPLEANGIQCLTYLSPTRPLGRKPVAESRPNPGCRGWNPRERDS